MYSGPAMRSESREVGVRGMKPSVVTGNGLSREDELLFTSEFVKLCANGADVNVGAPVALPPSLPPTRPEGPRRRRGAQCPAQQPQVAALAL